MRQQRRVVNLLRVVLFVLSAVVISLAMVQASTNNKSGIELSDYAWIIVGTVVFAGIIITIDVLTPKRKLSTITSILFGTFAGLVATILLSLVIDYVYQTFFGEPASAVAKEEIDRLLLSIKIILGIGLCYLGAAVVLQTQDDFRLVIPYVEFAKQIRGPKPLLLDTSAVIDGRVQAIAESGFFQTPIVIPRFVIGELQQLSDSSDRLKRARGRRGLDVVTGLQRSPKLDVTIDETVVQGKDVDQMLVELARMMPASIITTDVGLNRVASIQGVSVLSINDLANALKPNVIPGEALSVELIKPGEQPGQAVGYLDDGTMVVAENGRDHIGEQVALTVTSTMQTSAGRLIFGRMGEDRRDPSEESRFREAREEGETVASRKARRDAR